MDFVHSIWVLVNFLSLISSLLAEIAIHLYDMGVWTLDALETAKILGIFMVWIFLGPFGGGI